MADVNTARLCTEIVESHFGPLTAKVASILLTRGRLGLAQLVRFSGLKPRTIRACIIVLVQHNVLWHAHTEEEGEVVEFNIQECLIRLRFGRFVWQTEVLFGKEAAAVIQLLLDHGKLRRPEIISRLSTADPKSSMSYSQALHKLLSGSYIKPSTLLSHQSPRDKRIKYEAEERGKLVGLPTAKQLREAKEAATARLKREEEEAERVGLKRKAADQLNQRSSSKRKIIEEDEVDDDVYFRVNYDRYNVHIRNKLIESAVRERYNDAAASVMRAVLKTTEGKQVDVAEPRSDPVSLASIAEHILDEAELSSGLILPSSHKKPSDIALMKDYLGMLACADNPTPAGRSASFVSFGGSKVQVEFEIVGRRLRRRVLEAVTRERHGDDAVRIVRLLLDRGKMDEKQISKVAMMAPKDVRPLLSALSADSLVSLQEVPRSADRNPTRTFYLWYVDLTKAYTMLLGFLYKSIYNIGARRHAEAQEPSVKAVLDKRERSDVMQDERLLTRVEREIIQEWESRRDKLTVLEMRVEEAVFIIRDLGILGIEDE
ncbi:hypothetical protein GLOTRDRAFT_36462 [Gloeophyllum trabeum ATCC 11539]|uniref:DNA-directed RNA polymerase III subunit RPC3 n=1 Tax=Gloeophyllum trabeum (strain ATCC 11539 / FP-39264 / Madison 617) TaxID=670483 RepID=S7QFP5_GLOTA|nr:uncharacterized protein GLOTRDRAFT_36462 [Gloeophyllum trabeum ATCC 11539]EPQ58252.1 hypothetical protein GLOTRDRAFT_36462 [Gloeophyllum trabeum ATCC 11539]